jgi:hypothetical protein
MPIAWPMNNSKLRKLKGPAMQDYSFEHETLLNGSPVTVEMSVSWVHEWDGESYAQFALQAVYFDGVDVSPILTADTLSALEMEAESAHTDNV